MRNITIIIDNIE